MKILKFNEFSGEPLDEREMQPMSPVMKKSLDELGKLFKTEDDIIKAIEKLGYKRHSMKHRSSEYAFRNPEDPERTYITYTDGSVRLMNTSVSWYTKQPKTNMGRVSMQILPTLRDRLLLILRVILKKNEIYQAWLKSADNLKSDDPVGDFLHKKRGYIAGKKYKL